MTGSLRLVLFHVLEVDLLPWLVTFFVSLGAGFEYGIILGVLTSLVVLLYPWSRPRIQVSRCVIL